MSEPDWAPLTGFRVAVTSARRADELGALLKRRGATVTSAAAIAMVPLPDDDELRQHTEALIDVPPDIEVLVRDSRVVYLDRRRGFMWDFQDVAASMRREQDALLVEAHARGWVDEARPSGPRLGDGGMRLGRRTLSR